jgi:hypothetical protein
MTVVRPRHLDSLVTAGRVSCPYSRGDVDVDVCFACASFEGMSEGNAAGKWLRCRGTRSRPTYGW